MANKQIPGLRKIVLDGLNFFSKNQPPRLDFKASVSRFVVGSVNAYNTGRMLFAGQAALLADEGNFSELLKTYRGLIKNKTIKEAVIVSASGEKDSIWEIKAAKKAGLKTVLLTCNADATGAKLANQTIAFRKIAEPYSYNFSTYLGMILSVTGEDPKSIRKFLSNLKIPTRFRTSKYFSFILPDRYKAIVDMLKVKDDELFGPYSSLRAYPEGSARHAKFICQSKRELIISFGPNKYFGDPGQRWEIKLPAQADFGFILSLAYYLAGLIQDQKPDYFKRGLSGYCLKTGPKPYGQSRPFPIIVPGN